MSDSAIDARLKEVFESEFALAQPAIARYYQNLPVKQPSSHYVVANVTTLVTRRENLGSQLQFRKHGVINVQCFAPEDQGMKKLLQIADSVAKIFIDRQIAIPGQGALTTYECETKHRGALNGFYCITVTACYRAHVSIER